MKRIMTIISLLIVLVCSFGLIGCTDDKAQEQKDFEFTEEVVLKINDEAFSNELIKYCNDFYKHYQVECEKRLYIENDSISSTVATKIRSKIDAIVEPYLLNGNSDKARELLGFYMPFIQLGGIRAKEYLNIKYDWQWDLETGEMINTNPSPLTDTYINGIKEQFDILKKDYFKN